MGIFKYQLWHFLILIALLTGIYFYINNDASVLYGELFGFKTSLWLLAAIISPIVHQLYVLVCWRSELFYNSFSKKFGKDAFNLYKIGFAILILSRIVTLTLLAISNHKTFNINNILTSIIAGILLVPTVYLFYSVKKYFGMDRAFGIDHFKPEEFKSKPFVKKGIFKYTSNGMYIFGFLILYIPGLIAQSKAALLVALFSHIYIWVHYYFTELPDIKLIYSDGVNYKPNNN
ncbi:phosphatidylethanolamine N-methyltransferase family protein [Aegicerativicinus sediminis]|uniref:phosphatidylethanolamine N-methyltransferase family protein n=1 Tax=Aegicerativicinus sediminis TaxID=2893202 RepID=UPI001E65A575|nr:phosphatidylethanolamine N-methyltransferase family protein [Aegicerativicinus sediminis]